MKNKTKQNNKIGACPAKPWRSGGFTIIETMISISLFLVIVMAGMGALLNANLLHTKSQDMRSVMDSLSFMMEDMSKNIRTGYNYHCIDDGDVTAVTPHSCIVGGGISFTSSHGEKIVYAIQGVYPDFSLKKSSSGGAPGSFVTLNPFQVKLDQVSSFSILGAEPLSSGDKQQPFVIIRLVGKVTSKGVDSPFSLQTSVSQRLVDNQ